MTNQTNPPRTIKALIAFLKEELATALDYNTLDEADWIIPFIHEAEARGRAERDAELRAGAEPVAWRNGLHLSFMKPVGLYGPSVPLYTHPPVPREGELAAEVTRLRGVLIQADQFISNGIELGYIRMPDSDTPDSAHKTPGLIRAALSAAQETRG